MGRKKFEEDPRYIQCNREAIYGSIFGILNLAWWYIIGYGLGSKNPDEYKYTLGLPNWLFYSCVLGGLLVIVATFFMVNKLFDQDMPLGEMTKEEADKYREKILGGRDGQN